MFDRKHYEELVKDARARGDKKYLAVQLGALGNQCADEGDPQSALQYMNEAVDIYKSLHDNDGIARKTYAIAGVYEYLLQDYKMAIYYLKLGIDFDPDLESKWKNKQRVQRLENL